MRPSSSGLLLVALLGCPKASTPAAPPDDAERVIDEARCADVTVRWWARPVQDGLQPWRGLTRVEIEDEGARANLVELAPDAVYDRPEIVFSPDCAHAAILRARFGPIEITATDRLLSVARGDEGGLRYISARQPCDTAIAYGALEWADPTSLRFAAGRRGATTQVVALTDTATAPAGRCRDRDSPLYEAD